MGRRRKRNGMTVLNTLFQTHSTIRVRTKSGTRTVPMRNPIRAETHLPRQEDVGDRIGRNGLIPVPLSSHLQNFSACDPFFGFVVDVRLCVVVGNIVSRRDFEQSYHVWCPHVFARALDRINQP